MRRVVFLGVCLLVAWSSLAGAQVPTVGMYADAEGANCNITDNTPGAFVDVLRCYEQWGGATAAQFAAPAPACLTAQYLADQFVFSVNIGNSQDGISIGFGTCEGDPIHVLTINYFAQGTTPTCCEYPVIPHPEAMSGEIELVDCNFEPMIAEGLVNTVNGDASCPCPIGGANLPPATPSNPVPAHMAVNQPVDVGLSWVSSDPDGDPLVFDVFFGTTSSPPLVSADQSASTYDPGLLAYETTYYWRILAKDDHGNQTSGPEWQFTTRTAGAVTSYGMVADDGAKAVHVFDADGRALITTIPLGAGEGVGDCAITPDGTLGFVTDFSYQVWVVDLTAFPPSLALGTNPIPISNYGEDVEITADGRFLVVCDGAAELQPVSVVDIASRTEISTLVVGGDCNSVSLCDNGTSILVTSSFESSVRRITIDAAGNLTDTGEMLSLGGETPMNCYCAPGSQSGVVVTAENTVHSFSVPGLQPVNTRALSAQGVCGTFNPTGDRVYIRTTGWYAATDVLGHDGTKHSAGRPERASANPGAVDVFSYDPVSGVLSSSPIVSQPVLDIQMFYGMEQMAMNLAGTELYVPEGGTLSIYHPVAMIGIGSISDPAFISLTGVSLGVGEAPEPPVISVTPLSLDETLPPDDMATQMMTISNSGGSNLFFNISIGFDGITATDGDKYVETRRDADEAPNSINGVAPDTGYRIEHVSLISPLTVLYYTDLDTPDSRVGEQALINLGVSFTGYVGDYSGFLADLGGGTWDVVLFESAATGHDLMPLADYADAGGKLITSYWEYNEQPSFALSMSATWAGSIDPPMDVFKWVTHPIFMVPNETPDFMPGPDDHWWDNGDRFEPAASGEALAGYVGSPTSNQAAIVLGNGGRTILNGMLFEDYLPIDNDSDGKADIVELVENEIVFLCGSLPPQWLTAAPTLGTVPPGESMDIVMTFNSAGLPPGDYFADVVITSNDGVTPEVTVDAHLEVTDIDCPIDCIGPNVTISEVAGRQGDIVVVDVGLQESLADVDAFGLDVRYDTDLLQYVGCAKGDLTGSWVALDCSENTVGVLTVGGFGLTPILGGTTGSVARLSFEVVGCEAPAESRFVPMNFVDDFEGMDYCCGRFTCEVYTHNGDVNDDGQVTPGDALCAFQAYLSDPVPPPTPCDAPGWDVRADVNCDGMITPGDALCIFEYWLDGSCVFCDAPPSVAMQTTEGAGGNVSVGMIRVEEGMLVLPVRVAEVPDLKAFGFELTFPSDVLSYVGTERTAASKDFEELDGMVSSKGVLRVGGYTVHPVATTSGVDVVELRFRLLKENPEGMVEIESFVDDLKGASRVSRELQASEDAVAFREYRLFQNHPNPFNPSTTIMYEIPEAGYVRLNVYDVTGRLVKKLVNEKQSMGQHRVTWEGRDERGAEVTTGVYFMRFEAGGKTQSKKMVFMK